jgi:hypothetical protein
VKYSHLVFKLEESTDVFLILSQDSEPAPTFKQASF